MNENTVIKPGATRPTLETSAAFAVGALDALVPGAEVPGALLGAFVVGVLLGAAEGAFVVGEVLGAAEGAEVTEPEVGAEVTAPVGAALGASVLALEGAIEEPPAGIAGPVSTYKDKVASVTPEYHPVVRMVISVLEPEK